MPAIDTFPALYVFITSEAFERFAALPIIMPPLSALRVTVPVALARSVAEMTLAAGVSETIRTLGLSVAFIVKSVIVRDALGSSILTLPPPTPSISRCRVMLPAPASKVVAATVPIDMLSP